MFRSGLSLAQFIAGLDHPKNPYSGKPNVAASHLNALFRGDVKARVSDELRDTLREVVRLKVSEPNTVRLWLGELDRACQSLRRLGDAMRSEAREVLESLLETASEVWVLWPRSAAVSKDIVSLFSSRIFELDVDLGQVPRFTWLTPDQRSEEVIRMVVMKPIAVAPSNLRRSLEERWAHCELERYVRFKAVPGSLCALPLIVSDPKGWGLTRVFLVLPDQGSESSQLIELPQLLVSAWRSENLSQVLAHLEGVYSDVEQECE